MVEVARPNVGHGRGGPRLLSVLRPSLQTVCNPAEFVRHPRRRQSGSHRRGYVARALGGFERGLDEGKSLRSVTLPQGDISQERATEREARIELRRALCVAPGLLGTARVEEVETMGVVSESRQRI